MIEFDFRSMPKIEGNLGRENSTKSAKSTHFAIFFAKKSLSLKKNKKCHSTVYTNKFNMFTIKNDSENTSKNEEFRFENSLKALLTLNRVAY